MVLAQRLREAKPQTQTYTVNALLDRLEEDYRIQGRKSLEETRHHVKPVRVYFGARKADDITPERLRAYVVIRQGKGVANATINRELAALRRAFNLAYVHGLVAGVPKFSMLKESNVRQGTYTKEEIDSLLTHLPDHVKPVVQFAYLTGRRRGEILQLKWSDVNLKDGYITIRQTTTKTGQPDKLPIVGELTTLLREMIESRDSEWLFAYRGKPFRTFYRSWRTALYRAGLQDRLFHDLRRTVVTDLVESGVPEQVAMAVTGHKTRAVFDRYHIVNPKAVRQALENLETHRKG